MVHSVVKDHLLYTKLTELNRKTEGFDQCHIYGSNLDRIEALTDALKYSIYSFSSDSRFVPADARSYHSLLCDPDFGPNEELKAEIKSAVEGRASEQFKNFLRCIDRLVAMRIGAISENRQNGNGNQALEHVARVRLVLDRSIMNLVDLFRDWTDSFDLAQYKWIDSLIKSEPGCANIKRFYNRKLNGNLGESFRKLFAIPRDFEVSDRTNTVNGSSNASNNGTKTLAKVHYRLSKISAKKYRMTIIGKGARRSWMVEIVNRGRDGSLQVKYVGADFLRRSKQRGAALGTTLRADQFYFAD